MARTQDKSFFCEALAQKIRKIGKIITICGAVSTLFSTTQVYADESAPPPAGMVPPVADASGSQTTHSAEIAPQFDNLTKYEDIVREYKKYLGAVPQSTVDEVRKYRKAVDKINKQKIGLYNQLSNNAKLFFIYEQNFKGKLPMFADETFTPQNTASLDRVPLAPASSNIDTLKPEHAATPGATTDTPQPTEQIQPPTISTPTPHIASPTNDQPHSEGSSFSTGVPTSNGVGITTHTDSSATPSTVTPMPSIQPITSAPTPIPTEAQTVTPIPMGPPPMPTLQQN